MYITHLFLHHELLAEHISRLKCHIGSHSTQKSCPEDCILLQGAWAGNQDTSALPKKFICFMYHETLNSYNFLQNLLQLSTPMICNRHILPSLYDCFKTDTSPSNKFQIVEWIYQLKEASVRDANATPPTIGTKVAITSGFGTCLASESGLILVNYPREE
jgi:hypothetical protein